MYDGTRELTAINALMISTTFSILSSYKNAQLLKADIEINRGIAIQWTAHKAEVHMPVLSRRYCLVILLLLINCLLYGYIEFNVKVCFTSGGSGSCRL